jgi:hypothetical protein
MFDWDWLLYEMWDVWDDFDLSINWGNIATVAVAIAAIIVSARFNVLTLRRSASQFQRGRQDAREDKLRAEIAAFFDALGARVALKEIMDPMADADRDDEASASAAKTQFINRFPNRSEMSAVYRRIGVQYWAIKVLSHDTTITGLVEQLMSAVVLDSQDFKNIIYLTKQAGPGFDLIDDARTKRAEREGREQFVLAIGNALMNYCFQHLQGI